MKQLTLFSLFVLVSCSSQKVETREVASDPCHYEGVTQTFAHPYDARVKEQECAEHKKNLGNYISE